MKVKNDLKEENKTTTFEIKISKSNKIFNDTGKIRENNNYAANKNSNDQISIMRSLW